MTHHPTTTPPGEQRTLLASTIGWAYTDLRKLRAAAKAETIHVNARTVPWRARQPVAMPLGWEGDDG